MLALSLEQCAKGMANNVHCIFNASNIAIIKWLSEDSWVFSAFQINFAR
jgi:hypothetical protein